MGYTADEHNQAKSDMLGELNKAIADAEELRKPATEVADEGPAAAQEKPEEKPESAGADPAGAPGTVV